MRNEIALMVIIITHYSLLITNYLINPRAKYARSNANHS